MMKEFLENRIKELREADAKFCAERWDMEKPEFVRNNARGHSNSVTLARQELEKVLEFFNILNTPVVSGCFPARLDKPYPTIDILKELTTASEILLHDKNYDGHGWEIIAKCVDESKEVQKEYNNR